MEQKQLLRNFYIDNLKAVLIFLVVFGHLIEPYIANNFIKYIYSIIYIFHMPFFAFISGYLAKQNTSSKKIGKYFILYLIFQIIFIAWIFTTSGKFSVSYIFIPYWTLWYLFSFVCWLLLLKIFKNIKPATILVLFLLGLLVGYLSFIRAGLSLSRTITLFPFFMLGFYLKNKKLDYQKITQKIKFILPIISIIIMAFVAIIYLNYNISNLYYKLPYELNWTIFHRLITYLIAIIFSIQVALIVPHKKFNILTKFGQQSLSIFIFHSLFIKFFMVFKFNLAPYLIIIISFVLSIFLCYLFSLKLFSINKFLK